MTARAVARRVGVCPVDLTPAAQPGRSEWGRPQGLVVVVEDGEAGSDAHHVVAICAVAGAVTPGARARVAEAAGWPADALVMWPGAADALGEDEENALARAIVTAWNAREPGGLVWGSEPCWAAVVPTKTPRLLAGQRLERSSRQLSGRAPDAKLGALCRVLSSSVSLPGLPWERLLVDARVGALGVWTGPETTLRGVVVWVPGRDAFFGLPGWSGAGTRGAVERGLASSLLSRLSVHAPVVAVGDAGVDARLEPRPKKSEGVLGAIAAAEQAAGVLSAAAERALDGAVAVGALSARCWSASLSSAAVREGAGQLLDAPASAAAEEASGTVLCCDDEAWVSVPGRATTGLGLAVARALGRRVWLSGPVGERCGTFAVTREVHADSGLCPWGPEQGRFFVEQVQAARVVVASVGAIAENGLSDVVVEEVERSVDWRIRRGRAGGKGPRVLTIEASWRATEALVRPGSSPRVTLERQTDAGWQTVRLGGVAVDDRHHGMRLRVRDDGRVFLRWTTPEPRRWAGRVLRLRLGRGSGAPGWSAPRTVG